MRYRSSLLAGLAVTAAVGSALLLVPSAVAGPTTPYSHLVSAATSNAGGAVRLSVVTGSGIPGDPVYYLRSALAFGYAWLNAAARVAIVLFVHATATGAAWHVRSVRLDAGTTGIGGPSAYCVAVEGPAQGTGTLSGETATVSLGLHFASASPFDTAASLLVRHDDGCSARHHWGWVILSSVAL